MVHQFDPDIAVECGIPAAVLFQNIVFWIEKNETNNTNFHDGSYWTYNSIKAFTLQFPYLTQKQIRTALSRLSDAEYIKTGNYNEAIYDRTLWYALAPKGQMKVPKKANGNCPERQIPFAPEGKPIPDINTDNKPDIKPDIYTSTGKEKNGGIHSKAVCESTGGYTIEYALDGTKD